MICVLLVAGHWKILENQIKEHGAEHYAFLQGVPKALLPAFGGKRILDFWWDVIKTRQLFSEVYLVTNADKYKYFERWATASDFPEENIINDGTTTFSARLGAVADFELAIRTKCITDDVLVIAGDMLCQDNKFDLAQVINYFKLRNDGDLAIYYEMDASESVSSRGIVEICPKTNRILQFLEKPSPTDTHSRLASIVFYCLRQQTLPTVNQYLRDHPEIDNRNFGNYMEWLINEQKSIMYGMKLPTGFQLIGQVRLVDYEQWVKYFSELQLSNHREPITKRAYARVGLMGNPSDGFFGKTISLSISNFWAEVTIQESQSLVLVPHPLNDPTEFGSLADLYGISRKEGYLGGLRLLQATCKKFYEYCCKQGIALGRRNFSLKYDTNIPRQVGLAGSSAIVTATLKCLMEFYSLTDADIPKTLQPQFILDVERDDLFINAGLQDRVVQIYEGLVYMDFSKDLMAQQGHGLYFNMDMSELPKFWLAYLSDPSDSGKIHSDVNLRWQKGDCDIVEAMKKFAELTDLAKVAIETKNWPQLGDLMNLNFDLRRRTYTDQVLGLKNLKMIEIGRELGAATKFPGSGGAVLGLCPDNIKLDDLKTAYQAEGYVFCEIIPNSERKPPISRCLSRSSTSVTVNHLSTITSP